MRQSLLHILPKDSVLFQTPTTIFSYSNMLLLEGDSLFFAGGLQGVWSLMKTDTDKAADQQGENYGTDNITFSYKPG